MLWPLTCCEGFGGLEKQALPEKKEGNRTGLVGRLKRTLFTIMLFYRSFESCKHCAGYDTEDLVFFLAAPQAQGGPEITLLKLLLRNSHSAGVRSKRNSASPRMMSRFFSGCLLTVSLSQQMAFLRLADGVCNGVDLGI